MISLILGFGIGFSISFAGFIGFMSHNEVKNPDTAEKVLSAEVTYSPIPIISPTASSEPTPVAKPTFTPTPKSTQNPKPAITSTPVASSSPSSTPVVLSIQLSPSPTPDVWSPAHLEPWFAQYSGAYGVDKNVMERIANCESHFNPNATNGDYVGLFQFSPSTWANYRGQLGLDGSLALRTNSEESIRTAAFAISKFGTRMWPSCL